MKDTTSATPPVIEARGLGLVFQTGDGPVHALKDVNLTHRAGRVRQLHRAVGLRQDHLPARDRGAGDGRPEARLTVNGMTPGRGAAGAGLWLCLSGGGALSVADDCGKCETATGNHGVFARASSEARVRNVL